MRRMWAAASARAMCVRTLLTWHALPQPRGCSMPQPSTRRTWGQRVAAVHCVSVLCWAAVYCGVLGQQNQEIRPVSGEIRCGGTGGQQRGLKRKPGCSGRRVAMCSVRC